MSYASLAQNVQGIRKAVFCSLDGCVLETVAADATESENTAALAAVFVHHVQSVGQLLGLGTGEAIIVRSGLGVTLVIPRKDVVVTLDVDPKRLSPDLEAKLRAIDWSKGGRSARPAGPTTPPPIPSPASKGQTGPAPSRPPAGSPFVPPIGLPSAPPPVQGASIDSGASQPRTREPLRGASVSPTSEPARALDVRPSGLPTPHPSAPTPAKAGPTAPSQVDGAKTKALQGPTAGEAMFGGDLELVSLPDLLEFLRNGQRTGTLVCESRDRSARIRFSLGKIVDAVSPKTPPGPFLSRLVEDGVVSEEQLGGLGLSTHQADVDAAFVARKLVNAGFWNEETSLRAVEDQIQVAVGDLVGWVDGRFAFHPGSTEPDPSVAEMGVDPQMVLLRILKEQDEASK